MFKINRIVHRKICKLGKKLQAYRLVIDSRDDHGFNVIHRESLAIGYHASEEPAWLLGADSLRIV
jgi:hypothetical protein